MASFMELINVSFQRGGASSPALPLGVDRGVCHGLWPTLRMDVFMSERTPVSPGLCPA